MAAGTSGCARRFPAAAASAPIAKLASPSAGMDRRRSVFADHQELPVGSEWRRPQALLERRAGGSPGGEMSEDCGAQRGIRYVLRRHRADAGARMRAARRHSRR
jgi:hypothetical protein